jgi:hypothetical protein
MYPARMDDSDGVLAGGNASGEVLRIGPTVRKPWIANTPVVHAPWTRLARFSRSR